MSERNGSSSKVKGEPGPDQPSLVFEDLELSVAAEIPTQHGVFAMRSIRDADGTEHAVLYRGIPSRGRAVPVRIHSECLTSEVFHSLRCDCREQLESALQHIVRQDCGALIYLRQEGRGIGLFNKIRAYALQDQGRDTVEANTDLGLPEDSRSYEIAVKVLRALGISSVQLLTNNPLKIQALQQTGIEVAERIPIATPPTPYNDHYLRTKKSKMDHLLFDSPE